MNKDLSYYLNRFDKLRRAPNNGGAPHKPILLLAVIEAFDSELLADEKIYLTPELVSIFKTIWASLVTTNHHPLIAQPFFHLRSEPFWRLIANPGYEKILVEIKQLRSINIIRTVVNYALIDPELTALLLETDSRDILRHSLIASYFPNIEKDHGVIIYQPDYFSEIRQTMVAESKEEYAAKLNEKIAALKDEEIEEELFIRSAAFKREILNIYNNTCCISGIRIDTVANVSMVDACHIVSFAESHDDTVGNGISLTPTLHRAFDRGLIAIDDKYRIMVSKDFTETSDSSYAIRQFAGQEIKLPQKQVYYPGRINLSVHREKYGF
jgi:putative restriction endonuclease